MTTTYRGRTLRFHPNQRDATKGFIYWNSRRLYGKLVDGKFEAHADRALAQLVRI